jgi:hypothetical protein
MDRRIEKMLLILELSYRQLQEIALNIVHTMERIMFMEFSLVRKRQVLTLSDLMYHPNVFLDQCLPQE